MNSNTKNNSKFQAALERLAGELSAKAGSSRHGLVLEALRRIESGAYGICRECGCEINEERLEIIPEATHCVGCQRSREQFAESSFNAPADAM